MAAASILRSDTTPPEPAAPDGVLLAFLRLCRQLDRPVTEPELRAAITLPEAGADLGCLQKLAARFGFALEIVRANPSRLAKLTTPFLILGRQPGQAWVVRARTQDQVVLVDPIGGGATACTFKIAAGFGDRLVRLTAAARTGKGFWRSLPMRGVRDVLWHIALASVVINLLALATPLFMMTVYNKVINHAALQTLDVLAIGMVALVAFELLLRSLRG